MHVLRIAPILLGLLAVSGAASAAGQTQAPPPAADAVQLTTLPAPTPTSPQEYAARRAALAATMQEGIFVAFGSAEPDLDYLPWAQEANFRYLTGILEPDAGLLIARSGGSVEEFLFVRDRDPSREIWEGARLGVDGARERTGIPAYTSDRLIPVLDSLLTAHPVLHIAIAPPPQISESELVLTREQQIVRGLVSGRPQVRLVSVAGALDEMRATKAAVELDFIRRAVQITTLAHREAMRSVEPEMNEFEIQALIEYTFRRYGAERPAFQSIVGSGPNTTTLHYRNADRVMRDGELLLMDIGASYRGYAADVTRTIPVSGTFSPEQRAIYEIVLEAQKAGESRVRAGSTWNEANAAANVVIASGLTRLGLIDAPEATYACESPQSGNRCSQLRLFYMHALGHGVGLEVHDPDISYFGQFGVGSAFTIEPGIYVRDDVLDYLVDTPENRTMIERLRATVGRYAGIGVRIEDTYIVTAVGLDRVSDGVPREIAEIEAHMRDAGIGQFNRRSDMVDWYPATAP